MPRADFTVCPVYKGENPFKGTYKRNHEGKYYTKYYEVHKLGENEEIISSDI